MDVELRPCPWCGKGPNIGPWGAQDLNAWPGATAIECSSDLHDCPVNPSVTGYTRAEAITAWNTRHGAGDADRSAELTTAWMAGAESVRDRAARDAEDAARYRWLREQNTILDNPSAWTITRCDFTDDEGPSRYWVGSDLDAAIDAARAGERG